MALGSKYTKGIEIELGGNSTKLKTALDGANRSIKTTQSELDTLQNKLKLEWDPASFKRAQELAQRSVQLTTDKAGVLKKALAELDKQGDGKNTEQYEAIRRELSYVEVAAQKAQAELENINNLRFDRVKKELEEVGSRLNSAGDKLTTGLTVPLVAAGVASVKFASDTTESLNKVDVAFAYASEGVRRWSDTTLTSYGLAKGTALDLAALYGDMATSMGYNHAEAAKMAMELVGLTADIASFKNISIEQSGTALKSIFTGETESLKNLGVVMTEINLKAYALANGYKTAYEKMDQAQKVALRYQYVLSATSNAQGDFARTSDGTANQLRILQESLKEAAATAGNELLPIITPMINQLNGLIQSFGSLDEGTRKAVVQAGLFLALLGPTMKLTGGVTTAISAGVTVYQALTTAQAAATAAQTGLNVAMNANVIGAVITAAGALVAVLGSFVAANAICGTGIESVSSKAKELTKSINESRDTFREATAELNDHQISTLGMAQALEEAVAVENKTAAQKAIVLGLVRELNEAIPELNLAYDKQTDSLNMTTEALDRYIEAEARRQMQQEITDRMVNLEKERIQLAEQLEVAQIEAAAALEEYNRITENGTKVVDEYDTESAVAQVTLGRLNGVVKTLTEQQRANEEESSSLQAEYGNLSAAAEGVAAATTEVTDAASSASAKLTELTGVLDKVQGGYDLLTKAQKEMADSGYLSIDTVKSMLEKYPDLYGYLVETEGGYRLADGALQSYITSQRAEYQLAYDNAASAAQAIIDAEVSKRGAIIDTTASVEAQLLALATLYETTAKTAGDMSNLPGGKLRGMMSIDAPFENAAQKMLNQKASDIRAALDEYKAAKDNLGGYDRVTTSLGRDGGSSSGGSGKKGETQEDKNIKAYKAAMDEMEFLRDTEQISEADYYAKMEALRDKYLAKDSDEWRNATVKLYDYKAAAYERELKTLDESLAAGQITLQQHMDGLKAIQTQYLEDGSAQWRENQEQQAKDKQSMYDKERADQDYFHDVGLTSDHFYYIHLAELRDKYLEEGSEAWRKANVEIYKWQEQQRKAAEQAAEKQLADAKKAYQSQLSAMEKSLGEQLNAQKDAAKDAYDAKKKQIQAELDLEKQRLNEIIDGIDAEVEARRRLREDENQDDAIAQAEKRLAAARTQLEFARSDEDRAQWEKEIVRLQEDLNKALQDKEDTAFYREKEAEKEAVKDRIEAAEEAAKKAQDSAEEDYQASLDRLEREYDRRLEAARAEYARQVAEMEREQRRQSVLDKLNAASSATQKARQMAGTVGEVASQAANVSRQITQNVTKSSSANLTINQAPSLTEGQIARAMGKVLDELDR